MTEDSIIAAIIAGARRDAAELGDDSDSAVITILARMVRVATHGASAGFLRLKPDAPANLNIRKPAALDIGGDGE